MCREPYPSALIVGVDKPGNYQPCSHTMKDCSGKELFVAAAQIKKNYVSFHLMPVYARPDLLAGIWQMPKKRMQGKSCFNLTMIGPALVHELDALTKKGFEHFKKALVRVNGR